jgi:hypothetical protein
LGLFFFFFFLFSLYFGPPLVFILFDMFLGEGCVVWASWDGLILSLFCLITVFLSLTCDVCTDRCFLL